MDPPIPLTPLEMRADYASPEGMRQQDFIVDCVGDPAWKAIGHQMAREACLEGEEWLGCWWNGRFRVQVEMAIGLDDAGNIDSVKTIKPES